ncbi:MAG TPA: RNA polymerase sigma factor, partial [Pyrinomonadaceae bacterium]|nr:RNA polymerase sigma factor [Pyrinomonadaceae bacterium]
MNQYDNQSDTELLQAMLAGDEDALGHLYRRRHDGVYRFALHMSGSPAVAEDVTQEVFMVLIREGHAFDCQRGTVNSFLLGVARNHVLRRAHRERFYVSLDEEGHDECGIAAVNHGPGDELLRRESITSVRRAVLALPEKYREVVVLCDLQEMSYAEAAEILKCAVGTVRSRLHRGRSLLIDKLRPVEQED